MKRVDEVLKQRFERELADVVCISCGTSIRTGAPVRRCQACADREMLERVRASRLEALVAVAEVSRGTSDRYPKFPWARFENHQWVGTCDARILAAARKWNGIETMLLVGNSGCGKSSVLVARMRELYAQSKADILEGNRARWLARWHWTTASALSTARSTERLGQEPDELRLSRIADLLIIDELGIESPRDDTCRELVFARYDAQQGTVVTSGMTVDQIRARYGDAMYRRLSGLVVESW